MPMAGEGPKVAPPSGPPNRQIGDRNPAPTGGGQLSRNRDADAPGHAKSPTSAVPLVSRIHSIFANTLHKLLIKLVEPIGIEPTTS